LIFFVIIPTFILSRLNALLGPFFTLVIALAFPFAYGIYDFIKRKQASPLGILGILSVFMKGLFAFYKVDGFWFAVQEALIPVFLGVFTLVSAGIGRPFVSYFIYNDHLFNTQLLQEKLKENQQEKHFQTLIWQLSLVFGFAFFLGGILNYFLARHIIISPAQTEAFNKELAEMTWKGYFVVALPKFLISLFGLWWFVHKLKILTGLKPKEILN